MNLTTYPASVAGSEIANNNAFFDMMSQVGKVYSDSIKTNSSEMWMSSARIVQEHATRAMVNAAQECITALTQNASELQQRSLVRLGSANQRAMELMIDAFSSSWTKVMDPSYKTRFYSV